MSGPRCCSFVVLGLALTGPVCLAETSNASLSQGSRTKQASFQATDLKREMLAIQNRIRSISIVYESDDYDPAFFPRGSYLHREVALKYPDKMYHVSAHGHADLDWQDDFLQQRAYLSNNYLQNVFPVNRLFFEQEIAPMGVLPGSLPREFFFLATGIWPLSTITPPRPEGRPYVLREISESDEYCSVRPHLEKFQGHWCHVLENPGLDYLWIDTHRGFTLMARESYSSLNQARVQRMELTKHVELEPNIWLPTRMRNIQYNYRAPTESQRNRVVKDAMHEVIHISINNVSDSVFDFHPSAGTLKRVNGTTIEVDRGGVEYLHSIVSWVLRNQSPSAPGRYTSWPRWIVISIYFVPAIIVCGVIELLKRVVRLQLK